MSISRWRSVLGNKRKHMNFVAIFEFDCAEPKTQTNNRYRIVFFCERPERCLFFPPFLNLSRPSRFTGKVVLCISVFKTPVGLCAKDHIKIVRQHVAGAQVHRNLLQGEGGMHACVKGATTQDINAQICEQIPSKSDSTFICAPPKRAPQLHTIRTLNTHKRSTYITFVCDVIRGRRIVKGRIVETLNICMRTCQCAYVIVCVVSNTLTDRQVVAANFVCYVFFAPSTRKEFEDLLNLALVGARRGVRAQCTD